MYAPLSMAKAKRNKPEPVAAATDSKSLLDVAWRAYEAGDSVLARRAAKLLLSDGPREADESLAKKLGRQLFVGGPEVDARAVAAEISARTNTALKPYLFGALAAVIWVLLVLIAQRG